MTQISLHTPAPDFQMADQNGQLFRLSDEIGRANVLLVFNRGFAWPFCRAHMAQLRQDHSKFLDRKTIVVVVGPENTAAFKNYWNLHKIPFIGIPDPSHSILKLYGQQIKLFKLGRMPAQVLVDKKGLVCYVHYGDSMSDIPVNKDLFKLIEAMGVEN